LVGISLTAHFLQIGKVNPAYEMKAVHQEAEYQALTRRYTRYKKSRIMAIHRLKLINNDKGEEKFYGWKEIHDMVLKMREQEGYDSATAEGS